MAGGRGPNFGFSPGNDLGVEGCCPLVDECLQLRIGHIEGLRSVVDLRETRGARAQGRAIATDNGWASDWSRRIGRAMACASI